MWQASGAQTGDGQDAWVAGTSLRLRQGQLQKDDSITEPTHGTHASFHIDSSTTGTPTPGNL